MTHRLRESSSASAVVRRAVRGDLARIGELGALLVAAHHAFDSLRFLSATSGTKTAYASFLGSQLEEPEAAIFVAEENARVVGYAYAVVDDSYDYMALRGPAGILHDIIVEPASRGRGVGRLLLDAVLAFLKARGAPRVVLSTAEQNEAAQRLFASAEFRRTMIEMTREL
jgi:ribosomal protein S18 acetylase RimI-like enzyme